MTFEEMKLLVEAEFERVVNGTDDPSFDAVDQQKLIDIFREQPDPNDKIIHNYAEEFGMEPSDLETKIYKLLSDIVNNKIKLHPEVDVTKENLGESNKLSAQDCSNIANLVYDYFPSARLGRYIYKIQKNKISMSADELRDGMIEAGVKPNVAKNAIEDFFKDESGEVRESLDREWAVMAHFKTAKEPRVVSYELSRGTAVKGALQLAPTSLAVWVKSPEGQKYKFDKAAKTWSLDEDLVPGGKADDEPEKNFDPGQLRDGIKHEFEHTKDPKVAKEIAQDHLKEDPDYYKKLTAAKLEEAVGKAIKEFCGSKKKNIEEMFDFEADEKNPLAVEAKESVDDQMVDLADHIDDGIKQFLTSWSEGGKDPLNQIISNNTIRLGDVYNAQMKLEKNLNGMSPNEQEIAQRLIQMFKEIQDEHYGVERNNESQAGDESEEGMTGLAQTMMERASKVGNLLLEKMGIKKSCYKENEMPVTQPASGDTVDLSSKLGSEEIRLLSRWNAGEGDSMKKLASTKIISKDEALDIARDLEDYKDKMMQPEERPVAERLINILQDAGGVRRSRWKKGIREEENLDVNIKDLIGKDEVALIKNVFGPGKIANYLLGGVVKSEELERIINAIRGMMSDMDPGEFWVAERLVDELTNKIHVMTNAPREKDIKEIKKSKKRDWSVDDIGKYHYCHYWNSWSKVLDVKLDEFGFPVAIKEKDLSGENAGQVRTHGTSLGKMDKIVDSPPENLQEETPPGREDQVKALKKEPGIDNPWAGAWASYNKSHKKGKK